MRLSGDTAYRYERTGIFIFAAVGLVVNSVDGHVCSRKDMILADFGQQMPCVLRPPLRTGLTPLSEKSMPALLVRSTRSDKDSSPDASMSLIPLHTNRMCLSLFFVDRISDTRFSR